MLVNQIKDFLESKKIIVLGAVLGFGILWAQAHHPSWSYYISADVGIFSERAYTFFNSNSWGSIRPNEYLPGALYFFLVPLLFTSVNIGYTEGIILLNLLLLALHLVLLFRLGGAKTLWVGLVLIVAAGPILLYRFEVLVSLFVLEAYLFWKKGIPSVSGVLLGFATAVKLYPLLLVPVFLIASKAEKRKYFSLEIIGGFVFGLLFFPGLYLLSGGTTAEIIHSLEFHSLKPVGIESFAGLLLILQNLFLGTDLIPINAYGIHGLSGDLIKELFGLILAISVLLTWGVNITARKAVNPEKLLILSSLTILLFLLIFSTNFQPQYLFWPLIFVCLLLKVGVLPVRVLQISGLYFIMLVLEQFVYPLGYSDFLTIFYQGASQPGLFAFAIAGKLILIIITVLVLREFVSEVRLRIKLSQ